MFRLDASAPVGALIGPNPRARPMFTIHRDEGFLPWNNFKEVADSIIIRMEYEVVGGANMDRDYVLDILKWSAIYMNAMPPGTGTDNIVHARVIWNVSNDGVLAVDPIQGHINWPHAKMKHFYTVLVAWAKGRYSASISPYFH
jgi:hypothetical protein